MAHANLLSIQRGGFSSSLYASASLIGVVFINGLLIIDPILIFVILGVMLRLVALRSGDSSVYQELMIIVA